MYPTVDPETGLELNETKTDIVLLWFVEETKRAWLRAVIRAALWQFRGQWRYDLRRGVPYLETIFEANPDSATIANIFRTEIAQIPEVDLVVSLQVVFDGVETLRVDWVVVCGDVTIEDSTGLVGSATGGYPFIFGCEFSEQFS